MIKYIEYCLGEGAKKPYKKYNGDAGWDLYVSKDIWIPAGATEDVHTNIRIKMPRGIYGRITGRSSSLRKHGLLVNEGIIDTEYTGELFICVHNTLQEPVLVEKGTRVAQIIFHRIEDIRWSEVDDIKEDVGRGNKGFGSTGR